MNISQEKLSGSNQEHLSLNELIDSLSDLTNQQANPTRIPKKASVFLNQE